MIYIEPPRGASVEDLYRWAAEVSETLNRMQEEIEAKEKKEEKV